MKEDPHISIITPTTVQGATPTYHDATMPTDEQLEHERKEILRRYRLILRKVHPVLRNPKEDIKRIKAAFEMAEEAHRGERRKSGEPYIYHPLEVARIVVEEMGLGATSVICAFLHDVVEDTNITIEDIRRKFGDKEANIIDGLTKIKDTPLDNSTTEQIETFRKVLLNLSKDIRVVLIKIADRLHNMRTLESMRRDKQLRTIAETEMVYAPLAHRLGFYEIKSELEDLCLKYKSPDIYNEIVRKIKKTQPAREKFVKDFIKPIEEKLREHGFQFVIKSRVKAVSSIYNKMEKQKIAFEDVYDLFAIRIILDSPPETEKQDCWFVYSIVTDFYQPNPDRMRNWIGHPRSNGYESLHITVMSHTGQWVEVQIRSKRMDEVAEKGVAAHWRYKEKTAQPGKNSTNLWEDWLMRIRETLENRDLDGLEMMSEIYKELHEEEVYVFTPKGEMKILRNGSTVLDFAFMIHTQLGLHCLGAKVNGKLVPINYVLRNGDKVEIIKSSMPNATPDWLKIANNKRTQSKINQYLNGKRNAFVAKGREILKRKIEQMQVQVPQTEEFRLKLAKKFGQNSITDLEEKLGKDELPHNQIKEAIRELLDEIKKTEKSMATLYQTSNKLVQNLKPNTGKLLIGGQSGDIVYTLAKCCSPIKGEEVVGYMTVSRRLMVHRIDCPNAINQMAKDNSKVIPLEWIDEQKDSQKQERSDKNTSSYTSSATTEGSTQPSSCNTTEPQPPFPTPVQYEVVLDMYGLDRNGITNDITRVINDRNIMMRSIRMVENNGLFEGEIVVVVYSINQLENLIKDLEKIKGVSSVKRNVL
ncbi:MAG: RelA/SpoT family protein [Cytophagales bacterium]|nr:RelA/SpoT family protein [Bernardetiaceae bacterium]MDW8204088.1 RelA/SpoT family protein [Cytophagales bacterium]